MDLYAVVQKQNTCSVYIGDVESLYLAGYSVTEQCGMRRKVVILVYMASPDQREGN